MHLFRGVAIVAVVATHVLFELDWQNANQTEYRICVSLLQNGTVWFVFIAGLLFRHLAHRFNYATYLWTKLKFVVLPYVLVSLPYLVLQYVQDVGFFAPHKPENRNLWAIVVSFVSGEQMRIPLWFIPMICVHYLLAPCSSGWMRDVGGIGCFRRSLCLPVSFIDRFTKRSSFKRCPTSYPFTCLECGLERTSHWSWLRLSVGAS